MKPRQRATIAALVFVVVLVALAAVRALTSTTTATSTSASAEADAGSDAVASSAVTSADADSDADASSTGTSGACEVIAAANEAFLSSLEGRDAGNGCAFARPDARCAEIADAGVAWGHRVVDATGSPMGGFCATTIKVVLARAASADGGISDFPQHAVALQYDDATKLDRVGVRVLADYDHDGEPELYVEHEGAFREGAPFHETKILTFKRGAVAPYAPAASVVFDEVRDVDGDGLPDLLARGPYESVTADDAFGNSWAVAPAIFAQVAQANGTFRAATKQAVDFARAECGARKSGISFGSLDLTNERESALQIVCARLDGWSDADVASDARAKCIAPDGEADEATGGRACPAWWLDLARVPAPFRFK